MEHLLSRQGHKRHTRHTLHHGIVTSTAARGMLSERVGGGEGVGASAFVFEEREHGHEEARGINMEGLPQRRLQRCEAVARKRAEESRW